MKTNFLLIFRVSLIALLLNTPVAYSQSPTVDPSFQGAHVYNASNVLQAIEQPDGKRLLLGVFTHLNGVLLNNTAPVKLVRLLPNGALDATFAQNLSSLTGAIKRIALLPNGKILLVGGTQIGNVVRRTMMLLNTDGTADASFSGPNNVYDNVSNIAIQPDGKVVIAVNFLSGTSLVSEVRRLEANGALDASFVPNGNVGNGMVMQPDGKILVYGSSLVRLLSTGARDALFNVNIPANTLLQSVAVQADGKILVMASSSSGGAWPPLVRLLPDGSVDTGFNTGSNFNAYAENTFANAGACLGVQADGKILVATKATSYNGTAIGHVVRLLANGNLDPGFANATAAPDQKAVAPTWLQVQASGQIIVAGPRLHYAPANSSPTGVAALDANGARDASFLPRAAQMGSVADVALQSDGKYIIGGSFTEINGVMAENLARLQSDGSVDGAFTQVATVDAPVSTVVLQPDGKVLIGGAFKYVAGGAQADLARLLPAGGLDTAFAPTVSSTGAVVAKVAVQPDGKVLVIRTVSSGAQVPFIRVDGQNGQTDTSFQPGGSFVRDCVVQADGNIVTAGFNASANSAVLWRMLPSGALDPTLTPVSMPNSSRTSYFGRSLSRDALGRWCLVVSVSDPNGVSEIIKRRLPNGADDTSFAGSVSLYGSIDCAVTQPNNRIVVGGLFSGSTGLSNLTRLLESGQVESPFQLINHTGEHVYQLLVQPDSKIMVAGSFTQVGGTAANGLVRLLAANVLSVASKQTLTNTVAWPVPAHGNLQLALDAAAHPQRIALLDGTGRIVLNMPTSQSELTISLPAVVPGMYLLRVSYDEGSVTRRIVIE